MLADLLWIHTKRENPTARTAFQEVLASGVVIAFAPPTLEAEVLEHLEEISQNSGVPAEALRASWQEIRRYIRWVCPRERLAHIRGIERDPDDEPYVELALQLGAAGVVTRDADYESFGVGVVGAPVVLQLRTYARCTATELSIKVAGATSIVIALGSLEALVHLFRSGWSVLSRAPRWVQLGLAAALVAGALHEPTRKRLVSFLEPLKHAGRELLNAISGMAREAMAASDSARRALPVGSLRNGKPITLADHAVVACCEASSPLTLKEIAAATARTGYVSRSVNPLSYLRRVLRRDDRVSQLRDGRWTIVPL